MVDEPLSDATEPAGDQRPAASPLVVTGATLLGVLLMVALVWVLSPRRQPSAGELFAAMRGRVEAGQPDPGLRPEILEAAPQPERDPFAAPLGALPEPPPEEIRPPEGVDDSGDDLPSVEPLPVERTGRGGFTPPPALGPEVESPEVDQPPADPPERPRPREAEPPPEPEQPAEPARPSAEELRALDPTGPPSYTEPVVLADQGLVLAAVIQGRRPAAVFRTGEGYRRVVVGDEIAGYRVEQVLARVVYLRRGRARFQALLPAGPRAGSGGAVAVERSAAESPEASEVGPFGPPGASPAEEG